MGVVWAACGRVLEGRIGAEVGDELVWATGIGIRRDWAEVMLEALRDNSGGVGKRVVYGKLVSWKRTSLEM